MTHYLCTCTAPPFSNSARDTHVVKDQLAESDASRARHMTSIITRHIALNIVNVCSDRAVQGLCDVTTTIFALILNKCILLLNQDFFTEIMTVKVIHKLFDTLPSFFVTKNSIESKT